MAKRSLRKAFPQLYGVVHDAPPKGSNEPINSESKGDSSSKKSVLGDLETILGWMIENFEESIGKEGIKTLLKNDPDFKVFFIKEFYGLLKKYMDVKAAEVRATAAGGGKDNPLGTGLTQNFFIIKGLHDVETTDKQLGPGEAEVIEAEFRAVGLQEGSNA